MDDTMFAHARPASAMRRNHSHVQYSERPSSSTGDSRIYTPSLTSSTSAASSSQQSLSVLATPRQGSLLQERLRERKVESARVASMGSAEKPSERESLRSSPAKGPKEERRPGSGHNSKGMGVKHMEEQVSTLHKQNFDLKLELYHRRQRQETLEAQLEEKTKQLDELIETRELNDALLAELERRDQALDEAVGVIVNLEEKVERLLKEREMVKSVDEHPYNPASRTTLSMPTTPRVGEETGKKSVVRMPSFLSEQGENTEALRSLYLPLHHSFSEASLPHLAEEESPDVMNSPRLSVLSESSFISVYGEKLDLNATREKELSRHRSDSTIDKWVDQQPIATPTRQSPDLMQTRQFLSINDILESPLQRLEKLRATLEKANSQVPERKGSAEQKSKRKERPVKNVVVNKSFEHRQSLPPTPDTFSTNTLHRQQASDDTLAQRNDTSLDNTSILVANVRQNVHESAMLLRPRSAGETITSRREGHGWDTETQDDTADNDSVVSADSTYPASASFHPLSPRGGRVRTPDLFNFSTTDTSNSGSWGRDVMFSHHGTDDRIDLPSINNKRVLRARRSSMVDAQHPRSDDTVILYHASDNMTHPDPPARRSSLIATTKPRTVVPSSRPDRESIGTTIQTTPTTVSRTTRLASKLFGRRPSLSSSTALVADMTPPQRQQRPLPPQRIPSNPYYPSVLDSLQSTSNERFPDEMHSATPPPIRRAKTSAPQNATQVMRNRPVSAGQGASAPSSAGRVKRMSGFHENVRFEDEAEYQHEVERVAPSSGKERKISMSIDIGVARGLGALLRNQDDNTAVDNDTPPIDSATAAPSSETNANGDGKRKWLSLRRH